MDALRILFIGDEESAQGPIGQALRDRGCEITTCPDQITGLRALAQASFDVTIVDLDVSTVDAVSFLNAFEARDIETVLVLRSNNSDHELLLRALRAGAADMIRSSGVTSDEVLDRIADAMARRRRMRQRQRQADDDVAGSSSGKLQLVNTIALTLRNARRLEEAIECLLTGCQQGTGCDTAALLLLDSKLADGDLYLWSQLTLPHEAIEGLKWDLVGRLESLAGTLIDAQRVSLHWQAFDYRPIPTLPTREPFQTLCVAPMIARGEAVGIMAAAAAWSNAFQENELRLLNIFASLGGAVLHGFRSSVEQMPPSATPNGEPQRLSPIG